MAWLKCTFPEGVRGREEHGRRLSGLSSPGIKLLLQTLRNEESAGVDDVGGDDDGILSVAKLKYRAKVCTLDNAGARARLSPQPSILKSGNCDSRPTVLLSRRRFRMILDFGAARIPLPTQDQAWRVICTSMQLRKIQSDMNERARLRCDYCDVLE